MRLSSYIPSVVAICGAALIACRRDFRVGFIERSSYRKSRKFGDDGHDWTGAPWTGCR